MDDIRSTLTAANQEHLLDGVDSLPPSQLAAFMDQLKSVNFPYVANIFAASMESPNTVAPAQPVEGIVTIASRDAADMQQWREAGLGLIAQGRVAILLLAGGQGTRLGSSAPKGCYDIGLPSGKSLFQLQAERVLRLQQLAAATSTAPKPLRWYIMTSQATDAATRQYFADHAHFGLAPEQITFFQQGMLPALTLDGKIILEAPGRLSMAPDGNGGLYLGMLNSGVLKDMRDHGVEALDCYCVDNALARLGDPAFVGYCYGQETECGARVLARAGPEEKVGVFARRDGGLEVVEYSEMVPLEAGAMDATTGVLRYNWANICMHYFSVGWLERVAGSLASGGRYHIARKSIPSVAGPVAGIKLELFIFDTFPTAQRTALWEVTREEEFAPVKNAPGAATDSPDTARAAVLALHKRWVTAAGGEVVASPGIEVSPLVSYGGEGLEGLVAGKCFREVSDTSLQGCAR